MMHHELKHRLDNGGRFKLQWHWGLAKKHNPTDPDRWYYFYYATFDTREDALEHYERMVKPFWENVKHEICDQSPQTPPTHSVSLSS